MVLAKVKLPGSPVHKEITADLQNNRAELNGQFISPDSVPFDTPVTGTVYGTLLNFKGALEKMKDQLNEPPYKGEPKAPILYIKPANTLAAYGSPVPLPENTEYLQAGACLGIVIGKNATRVSEAEALEYVSGYTVVNDISIPHDSFFRPAIKEKCRDGFCPAGPWIVKAEDAGDPGKLCIQVFVNGELRQKNNTENLIRSVPRLIADVTGFMTLRRGDVLLAGVPEDPPLVKAGDEVKIVIEKIGQLKNQIVPEKQYLEEVAK